MHQSISPAWFLFIPCFGLMWCFIITLESYIGGWAEFAAKFPANDKIEGTKFNFVSAWLGFSLATPWHSVGYNRVLSITIGSHGLGLSVWFLYRIFHPPIFIRWSDIADVEQRKFIFWKYSQIYVSGVKRKIGIFGKAGQAVFDAYQAYIVISSQEGVINFND